MDPKDANKLDAAKQGNKAPTIKFKPKKKMSNKEVAYNHNFKNPQKIYQASILYYSSFLIYYMDDYKLFLFS